MKYFTSLLFCVFLMLSLGCNRIMIKAAGIKQPILENHQSLSKFLLSCKADTSEILCYRNFSAIKLFYKTDLGTPNAQFFNREKMFVDYRRAPSDCNAKVSAFIDNVDSINLFHPIKEKVLDDYLKDVVVQREMTDFTVDKQDYDAYVILYWAKYSGKISKSHLKEWQQKIDKANEHGPKIRMILLNVDFQSAWGMDEKDLPRI